LEFVTLPAGGQWQYGYDAAGRTASVTDPDGGATTYGYDPAGRVVSTAAPSGKQVVSGYDPAGRLTSQTAGSLQRQFGYDGAGRLTSATADSQTLTLGYDRRGLLTSYTDGLGTTTYGYDVSHRLSAVAPPASAPTWYTNSSSTGQPVTIRGTVNANIAYNSAGQPTTITNLIGASQGVASSYSYNANGAVTRIGTSSTDETTAGYNPDGLINSLSQTIAGNSASNTTTYAYDNADRLATATLSQGGTTVSTSNYGWDADGNRTSVSATGQPQVTTTYDLADRAVSTSDGSLFDYDLDGNLTRSVSGTATTTYDYNAFNEMAGATVPGGGVTYTDDPVGRIGASTSATNTQHRYYNGPTAEVASTQDGSNTPIRQLRNVDGALLGLQSGYDAAQPIRPTIHGDVARLFMNDSGGTTVASSVYDPFGNAVSTGAYPTSVGYQSMLTDPTTGLVDMGARSYDPTRGRFTTADSLAGDPNAPMSLNRYLYANGSPISYVDPNGHWPDILGGISDAWDWTVDRASDVGDFAVDTYNNASDFVGNVASGAEHLGSQALSGLSDFAGGVKDQVSQFVDDPDAYMRQKAREFNHFMDEHGKQIEATALSILAGGAVTVGCEILAVGTAMLATPLCVAAGGAVAGAVYNGTMCPAGESKLKCTAEGAVAGGAAGLVAGLGEVVGLPGLLVGAASGGAYDATDQLLATGKIDPEELLTATLTGGGLGALGAAGSRIFGKRPPRLSPVDDAPPPPVVDATPTETATTTTQQATTESIASDAAAETQPETPRGPTGCVTSTPNSFSADTGVEMADGSVKAIAKVAVGDMVLATDPLTHQTATRRVDAHIVGSGTKHLVDVKVRTDGSASATLEATANHPFWVSNLHAWAQASQLRPGDHLQTTAGHSAVVVATHAHDAKTTVYNLTVDTTHTYYVVAGDTPVLVHNCGGTETAPRVFAVDSTGETTALPVHEIDPTLYPDIANNFNNAVANGRSPIVTRMGGRAAMRANRDAAQAGVPRPDTLGTDVNGDPLSWEEFPFASTNEVGAGATLRLINRAQNVAHGRDSLWPFLRDNGIGYGDPYYVRVG
jgi:RHS repeat-associated protein